MPTGQPTIPSDDSTEGKIEMTDDTSTTSVQSADLATAIRANVPVLLMGAPGTAKTATLERIAREMGAYIEIVIASAQDPTTILGIPMPTEDRKYTEPTIPGWARRINAAHDAGQPTILFFDELTSVPPSVAGPMLGVIQSRRADGWTIPADTRIVAAANPPDLAVGGWALEPAMANRWVHIEWTVPTAEWTAWAAAQPSATLRLMAEYHGAVGDQLLDVPKDLRKRSGPWPSPRSWTNAAALIDATGEYRMAALAVGEIAAGLFEHWASVRDIPSVADLLSGAASLPERHDAFVTAVQSLADSVTAETLERTFQILEAAIPTDGSVVYIATQQIANAGHVAGIASIVAALEEAGLTFGTAR